MSFTIDYVSDWNARLLTRLYAQFGSDPVINAIVTTILAPQFQDLEDSGQSLFTLTDIDASEGVNLDVIGRVVGQLRLGLDDPTYRLLLKARVLANKSSGTVNQIIGVLTQLLGSGNFIYTPGTNASFTIQAVAPVSTVFAELAAGFLGDAKIGGVRAILEWQENTDDQMFYTDDCLYVSFMTSLSGIGSHRLQVRNQRRPDRY